MKTRTFVLHTVNVQREAIRHIHFSANVTKGGLGNVVILVRILENIETFWKHWSVLNFDPKQAKIGYFQQFLRTFAFLDLPGGPIN